MIVCSPVSVFLQVDMRIVPQDECKNTFENNGLSASRAHPSFLCVGGEPNKDTCDGDGGSPHVCFNQDNRYVLVTNAKIIILHFYLHCSRLELCLMVRDVVVRFLRATPVLPAPCAGLTGSCQLFLSPSMTWMTGRWRRILWI